MEITDNNYKQAFNDGFEYCYNKSIEWIEQFFITNTKSMSIEDILQEYHNQFYHPIDNSKRTNTSPTLTKILNQIKNN